MSEPITLLAIVLVASLAGSLHCAGMCGAFLAFAIGRTDRRAPRSALQLAYHSGRLMTYTSLGVLAGLLGHAINLGGRAAGFQQTAATIAAGVIIAVGLIGLARSLGVRVARFGLPRPMVSAAAYAHERAAALPPIRRAFCVGLITTLLPCGWLYAFVVVAAGTGSPLLGGATMSAFWLGTLPILVALGSGVQALLARFGQRVPAVLSTLVIIAGLTTLMLRTSVAMPTLTEAADVETVPSLYADGTHCGSEQSVDDD